MLKILKYAEDPGYSQDMGRKIMVLEDLLNYSVVYMRWKWVMNMLNW